DRATTTAGRHAASPMAAPTARTAHTIYTYHGDISALRGCSARGKWGTMRSTRHTATQLSSARRRVGLISLVGTLALLVASLSTAFAATGNLYAQSLTAPAGGLWLNGSLGGHLWVS